MNKNWLWAGALGVVAIIVVVIVIFAVRGGYQAPQAPVTTEVTSPTPVALINSVSASGQPAGQTVTIASVTLKENGFIAIHEDAEGKPGKVIGNSTLLQAGSYSNVTVNLTRVSKDDETLHPMLHSDDGDGTYGFPDEDFPIKDEQGNIVITKFIVGGTPQATPVSQSEVTITYNGSNFSLTSATVASGGKVTWVNSSSKQLQLGSNVHPVHTDNQEISGGKYTLDIAAGQSSSVTVTKKGAWGYHDHLSPTVKGTLTVE